MFIRKILWIIKAGNKVLGGNGFNTGNGLDTNDLRILLTKCFELP